jgi:tetratricopeptide (TPR) repeat protein
MSGLVAVWGLVSGGALGFLFGVPKLPRSFEGGEDVKPEAARRSEIVAKAYIRSNSNLEEISDWLTKIIVGLGLIHLTAIPSYVGMYRAWLKQTIQSGGGKDPMGLSWFLVLVTLSAAFIGFLFFYVQARTRMAVLLRETEVLGDRAPTTLEIQRAITEQQMTTSAGQPLEEASRLPSFKPSRDIVAARPVEGDAAVLAQMPQPTDSAERWGAWAAASARAGNLENAAYGWRVATERSAGSDNATRAQMHERYAEVLQALERNAEALAHYERAIQLGADEYSILLRELLVALYIPPPEGFRKALDISERLLRAHADSARFNPWIKVWRLAAFGQKHRWHTGRGEAREASAAEESARQLIKELLTEVPDPDSEIRVFLRQMIDPGIFQGDPEEDDLVSLRSAPDIYKLITTGNAL